MLLLFFPAINIFSLLLNYDCHLQSYLCAQECRLPAWKATDTKAVYPYRRPMYPPPTFPDPFPSRRVWRDLRPHQQDRGRRRLQLRVAPVAGGHHQGVVPEQEDRLRRRAAQQALGHHRRALRLLVSGVLASSLPVPQRLQSPRTF